MLAVKPICNWHRIKRGREVEQLSCARHSVRDKASKAKDKPVAVCALSLDSEEFFIGEVALAYNFSRCA